MTAPFSALLSHRAARVGPAFVVIASLAAGAGCARVAAVSEVKPDGSMTRTLTFNGNSAEPPPGAAAGVASSSSGMGGPHLSDLIDLPKAANGWKITRTQQGTSVTITATRTVPVGTSLKNDLGLKAPVKGDATAKSSSALLVENTATILQTAPGRLEYREVLHWVGPHPKDAEGPGPEITESLKKTLPANLSTDTATAHKVVQALQVALWQTMFGPGDPMLPTLMMHPDLAEYRLRQKLHLAIRQALVSSYGDRLTGPALDTAVEQLTAAAATSAASKTQAQAKPPGMGDDSGSSGNKDDTPLVALLLRVKMPGKIVTTNGQIDPDSGEVYWPFYSEAPAMEDVVLTATSDTAR